MKWFDRWFARKCEEAWEYTRKNREDSGMRPVSGDDLVSPNDDPVLQFRIYSANNGQILEFNRYDRARDRRDTSIYIVEKDRDIGEYVNKCVSLEMLK